MPALAAFASARVDARCCEVFCRRRTVAVFGVAAFDVFVAAAVAAVFVAVEMFALPLLRCLLLPLLVTRCGVAF